MAHAGGPGKVTYWAEFANPHKRAIIPSQGQKILLF
jgi:hypothetical protein